MITGKNNNQIELLLTEKDISNFLGKVYEYEEKSLISSEKPRFKVVVEVFEYDKPIKSFTDWLKENHPEVLE